MVWASPSPGRLVMTSSRVTNCCCWARGKEVRQRLAHAKHPGAGVGGDDSLNTLHCQPWACPPPPHTPSILFWKIQRKRHPQAAWGRRQGGVAEPALMSTLTTPAGGAPAYAQALWPGWSPDGKSQHMLDKDKPRSTP